MAHATMNFTFLIITFQFSIKIPIIQTVPSSFISFKFQISLPISLILHTHTHKIMMSPSAFLMLVMLMALAITRATPYENDSFLNDKIVLQSKMTFIL